MFDYTHYLKLTYWTTFEAVAFLNGYSPDDYDSAIIAERKYKDGFMDRYAHHISGCNETNWEKEERKISRDRKAWIKVEKEKLNKIGDVLARDLELGALIPDLVDGKAVYLVPAKFIRWAISKGFDVASELIEFIEAEKLEPEGNEQVNVDAGIGSHAGTEPKPKGKNQKRMDILNEWYRAVCLKHHNDIEAINQEINSLTNESIKKELASITQDNEKYLWANGANRWIMDYGESVWRFKRTQGGKPTKS